MLYQAISKLPFPALYLLSNIAAFFLFHIFYYRRKTSYKNLCRSFPEKSKKEIKRLQKSSYLHLTDSFLETLKASTMSNEELFSRVNLKDFEKIEEHLNNGQSIFFLTAHTAPIDWAAFTVQLRFNCIIDPVYKPIHSRSLDKFIFDMRSHRQCTPIPYKKLAKDVIVRKNVRRSIAMLADLEPRARDQALEVSFLNQPTRFFLASERIIKLTQLPAYFIGIQKISRGHYQAYAEKLSEQPNKLAEEELTKKYVDCVEKIIVNNPSTWLWTHRRWKHRTT